MDATKIPDVLGYFFGEAYYKSPPTLNTLTYFVDRCDIWFQNKQDEDDDNELASKFTTVILALRKIVRIGSHPAWKTFDGVLATIIFLGFISKRIFRNKNDLFLQDEAMAMEASRYIMKNKLLLQSAGAAPAFFSILPLINSEEADDQELLVQGLLQIGDMYPTCRALFQGTFLEFLKKKMATLRRFERLPERNSFQGRTSTKEEEEFLSLISSQKS